MLWYSLEAPRRGASNEYHNMRFREEIRKILSGYPSYLELWNESISSEVVQEYGWTEIRWLPIGVIYISVTGLFFTHSAIFGTASIRE